MTIYDIEQKTKRELVEIVKIQQEHDMQREEYIRALQAENVSLRGGIEGDLLAKYKSAVERAEQSERERDELRAKFGEYREEIVELKISRGKALKYFNALAEVWPDFPHSDVPLEEIIYLLRKRDIEQQIKGAEKLMKAFPLNTSNQMRDFVDRLRAQLEGK